jgi:glutamyl/glutaminyl-tRNA synthetase
MCEALAWLGLDWDEVLTQSELGSQHEAALDALASQGLLYPCFCGRKDWRARGRPAPDGGVAYDNLCRDRTLPAGGWRDCSQAVRLRLPEGQVSLVDESGLDLGQNPALEMGDPVVRRRDGVVAYHLVVVVDDAASGVTRVVRGHDLASSTAIQVLLHDMLDLPRPLYRHHFLLLEDSEQKLAKMRGSHPYEELKAQYSGPEFCGLLAKLAGLRSTSAPCTPHELVQDFDWQKVRREDARWQ